MSKPWSIVSGESSFAHTRTIINNQSSYIFVRHFEYVRYTVVEQKNQQVDATLLRPSVYVYQ